MRSDSHNQDTDVGLSGQQSMQDAADPEDAGIARNDPYTVDAHGGDSHAHGDNIHLPADSPGYETRDISIPAISKWWTVVLVFMAVTSLIVLGIYALFVPQGGDRMAGFPLPLVRRLPPQSSSILQANPMLDIRDYRADEEARLDNAKHDQAKMSVDAAKEAIAKRGFGAFSGGSSALPAEQAPADVTQEARLPAPDGGLNDERNPNGTPTQLPPTPRRPIEGALINPDDNNIGSYSQRP